MNNNPLSVPPSHRSRRTAVIAVTIIVLAGLGYLGWHFMIAAKHESLALLSHVKPAPPRLAAPTPSDLKTLQANLRGVGQMEQFNFPAAALEFEECIRLAPDWLPAQINLGIALLNTATRENLARASSIFTEVLQYEADDVHAHYCLGIIALHENRLSDAYPHFEAVSRIDPLDAHTWLHLAYTHPQGKTSAAAKDYFARALKLNPYLNAARYNLAQHPVDNSPEQKKKLLEEFRLLMEANWQAEYKLAYSEMGHYADVIGRAISAQPPVIGPPPLFDSWAAFRVQLAENTTWAQTTDLDDLTRAIRKRFGAAVVFLDFNRDGRPDLFLPSSVVREKRCGDLLLRNDGDGKFTDVTASAGLAGKPSFGCSVADYDNDGFPDLLLTGAESPRLLRNLQNGKFEDVSVAAQLNDIRGVCLTATWIDLDQDGDLDLLLAKFADSAEAAVKHLEGKASPKGQFIAYLNIGEAPPVAPGAKLPGLSTRFQNLLLPATLQPSGPAVAIGIGDLDGDRDVDLLLLADGQAAHGVWNDRLLRFRSAGNLGETGNWNGALLLDVNHDQQSDLLILEQDRPPRLWMGRSGQTSASLSEYFAPGILSSPVLITAQCVDLDLDSWTDVVGLSAQRKPVFLQNDGAGKLVQRPDTFGLGAEENNDIQGIGIADLDGDGPADLVIYSTSGLQIRRNLGNGNHALRLHLSGRRDKGSNLRTNADAIGSWVVAQTGTLWSGIEKTTLQTGLGQSSLPIDLGIGKATQADLVRIRWPDGVPQTELNVVAGPVFGIEELNRKGTSCPALFVWDGQRYRFVTDFLGAGAMGEASADGSVRPPRAEESILIEPGLLVPRDGWLRIKVGEPMDEVLYLDRLQLLVIDHPTDRRVVPDERFVVTGPPPTQELLNLSKPHFAKRATDHRQNDVTAVVRTQDRRFVDGFHRRSWLGYAEEHWLELDFGEIATLPGERLILCMSGWTDYPYPESICAADQAGVASLAPHLEYQAEDGKWKTWGELGFPAGLPRTMTRDVTELIVKSKGRFRIRTNMQIYWDQASIGHLEPTSNTKTQVTALDVGRAQLSHRGFVQEVTPGGKPPISYDDDRTEPVAITPWKGRLTRLGDVTELLLVQDDCFVLCGPGDEIEIAFDGKNLPPLPKDWTRSYVLRTWGYCKDTSPFTMTGGAVGPLPYRSMNNYPPATSVVRDAQDHYDRVWNTRRLGR